jgi:hypothetical protein
MLKQNPGIMAQEFEDKAKEMLNKINRKIEELLQRHDISKEDIQTGIDERIRELKKTRDKIEQELKAFGDDNKENFERIERAIGDAAKEIGDAFRDIFNFSGSEEKGNDKDQPKS